MCVVGAGGEFTIGSVSDFLLLELCVQSGVSEFLKLLLINQGFGLKQFETSFRGRPIAKEGLSFTTLKVSPEGYHD